MKNWSDKIEGCDEDAREARADEITEALEDVGYRARAWIGDSVARVYVKRNLSRGRRQDIGYLEIAKSGIASCCLTRNRAGICDMIGLVR